MTEPTNMHLHADGGYYYLLNADAPMKHPDSGEWIPGVIYVGVDGQMRSTSTARWTDRFSPVAEKDIPDDPEVQALWRRCNPAPDFDMNDVWASWHESESAINSEIIELTVAAMLAGIAFGEESGITFVLDRDEQTNITAARVLVKPEHLRGVLVNYAVDREPQKNGYRFTVRRKIS